MVEWVKGFFIPVIECLFIGGILLTIGYFIFRAFWNAWSRQTKFFFKYSIRRKQYAPETVKWCVDCIEGGIGYYDAKKLLLIKGIPEKEVYETMWIYDKILDELKGGIKK